MLLENTVRPKSLHVVLDHSCHSNISLKTCLIPEQKQFFVNFSGALLQVTGHFKVRKK